MKMIFLDMDGTLLNRKGKISRRNKDAIAHLQNKGVKVVIATGRHYADARVRLVEAGISCPVISLNGADIRLENGRPLWKQTLRKKDVRHMVTSAAELQAYLEIYCEDHIYSTFDGKKHLDAEIDMLSTRRPEVSRRELEERCRQQFLQARVKQIGSFDEILPEKEVYKILFFTFDNKKKVDFLSCIKGLQRVSVSSSATYNVEVNEIQCHKGFGLQKMADFYQIPVRHTVAVGDHCNDLPMFQAAGYSVAMGNAEEIVKTGADYVTVTNEQDGVAEAIYHLWPR
ncbi:Cof-type HAD-IIB family hydrolase [Lihuaxuella thermophila]|uniref:Cof subfamily of IIB subfamily of haloacid dehalogenase superfamily/HAD-superfamily hydrolase, subfamily IIB n=1 Tax=Lihuaxuella thermophila TaxID=1173111 RepID=A0A1H8GY87_9BACL|nr:Cof-type HAD-IIB family hydrolase [Lihuaxuella thermophila]SEN48963.1 hypothetical protein SAMN05444955_112130 [Lihuaxuella thermophila]